jgi:hypothetical protein
VLRRQGGILEARAIDWEQATVGQSCASDAFAFLLKSDIPQRVLEKLPQLMHMHRRERARMTPRKPHHKRTYSSEQENDSPQGTGAYGRGGNGEERAQEWRFKVSDLKKLMINIFVFCLGMQCL